MYRIKSFVMGKKKADGLSSSSSASSLNNLGDVKAFAKIGAFVIEGKNHPNEDRHFVCEDLSKIENIAKVNFDDTISFVGVYDGHGGSVCSEYLSKSLHRKIIAHENFENYSTSYKVLRESFISTDEEFLSLAKTTQNTSGSCAAIALINGLDITVAHCGDCRAILKSDKSIIELTKDHRPSRPSEKARIVSAGGKIIGGRIAGVLAPSRSFGDLDVKLAVAAEVVIPEPETITYRAELGKDNHAYLIIASDGVWDAMSNDKAMAIVIKSYSKTNDPQKAAAALAQAASEINPDDVTVAVVVWSLTTTSSGASSPLLYQTNVKEDILETLNENDNSSSSKGLDGIKSSSDSILILKKED